MDKKIIFAVGGTGGHLFPAQALCQELTDCEVLFAGGKLSSNPFFSKFKYPFREIRSGSPSRGNPLLASFQLLLGLFQSFRLLKEFAPDLVIGFGSFYSFPVLLAAKLKRVPYLLIESNALPGKVNRLLSTGAKHSAIQFEEAAKHMRGPSSLAKMPIPSQFSGSIDKREAKKFYALDPDCFTLLVFGGSQGAKTLNDAAIRLEGDLQILHFCGRDSDPEILKGQYEKKGIRALVKPFETQMHIAWKAADLALCRAGAGTLTELTHYSVPAILVPWPRATDDHQSINAKVQEKKGGALVLNERKLDTLPDVLKRARATQTKMQECLNTANDPKEALATLVLRTLEEL